MRYVLDMITEILRLLIKVPLRWIRMNIRRAVRMYIASLFTVGPLMTGVTTNLGVTDPALTIRQHLNSGIVNVATSGLYKPAVSAVKEVTGGTLRTFGSWTDSEALIQKGTNLVHQADAWFHLGPDGGQSAFQDDTLTKSSDFVYSRYPDYYQVVGLADVNKRDYPKLRQTGGSLKGTVKLSPLDALGRTGEARATLNWRNVADSRGIRQDFRAGSEPSGWGHQGRVSIPGKNGRSYNGYMWNRSHLIGDALGGDAVRENAVTGTRPQNVGNVDNKGGMRYLEAKVEAYLAKKRPEVVYYRAVPHYEGSELVPRYVMVYAMSSDRKINEKVKVFNTANGYTVNYQNGTFRAAAE